MAESRSQSFKQLNLGVLVVIKERYQLGSELNSKIDHLMSEWRQVDRVEFTRALEPIPNKESKKGEHHYENPPLLKFGKISEQGNEPKHAYITPRSSSPFEDKSKQTMSPQYRGPDLRANTPNAPSPVPPPRVDRNLQPENEFRPLPAIPMDLHPDYHNIPAPASKNIPPFQKQISREGKNTSQAVKEPIPMRQRDLPQVPAIPPKHEYTNVLDTLSLHPSSSDMKKSGLINTERSKSPFNTELRTHQTQYENRDEAVIRAELKGVFPQHEIGRANFQCFEEGTTIIDGENEHGDYPGHEHGFLPIASQNPGIVGPPAIPKPLLPPPYQSQFSVPSPIVEFEDLQGNNYMLRKSNTISKDLGKPDLPPKALPPKNVPSTANLPKQEVSYVNVLSQPTRERTELLFDNIHNISQDNNSQQIETDEYPGEDKNFRSPHSKDSGPNKCEEGYLVIQTSRDENASDYYSQILDPKDAALGVFNVRELINEKTDLSIIDTGNVKREVLEEKVASKEEFEFYETVSNTAVFFLYLVDHGILTQELLSLVNALSIELHNKLSPYLKFNFSKLKVSLGPAVGILDTLGSNGKGKKESLDVRKSLLQMKITSSHIINISQSGSELDFVNYERYMKERDQNMREHFQRSFIPLIQGAQPLNKKKVNELVAYLGSIYKIKDFYRLVPDAYNDPEMLANIQYSLALCMKSSPEEVMPQVIELAEESKLRESVYFRVKVNNKMRKKFKDTVLGISPRNIHLLGISLNEDIEFAYMWSAADIEKWSFDGGIRIELKNDQSLLMASPKCEKVIHEMLKIRVNPVKQLVNCSK